MATRFATATGVWSNTGIWDGGTLPLSDDTVHPNGFTVTIDQDINIASLNNNISPVYLPGMPIPKMTGNTVPSGTVNAGSDTSNAWKGFDQEAPTFWAGTGVAAVNSTAWLSYQFTAAKTIKRYYIFRTSQNQKPTSWIFQGSNNGSIWDDLETITANALTTPYLSPILPNTTAYLYYRINVTAVTSGTTANIYQFEMTESTATTYGITTGGSFTLPASLSGTRTITQTGEGIKTNSSTIITIAATSGATVNFNIASGGFIFNQTAQRTSSSATTPLINITGNCAVNFNANLWGNQSPYISTYVTNGNINIGAAATVTVNGNLYGARSGFDNTNSDCIIATTAAGSSLNIIGDVYGGTVTAFAQTIHAKAITTINITGNIYGDLSPSIFTTTTPTINIIGTVNLMNNNSVSAIQVINYGSLAQITINGYLVNKNNTMAIFANKIRFTANTNPYWVFQNSAAADITLAYGAALGAYPVEADVRFGTTYAASPTRTGTLRVPLPQYVSQGVLTDNTTGTAYINAADVWNVLSSSITTAGSIGERLKVASTVETTGDQLAAYIV